MLILLLSGFLDREARDSCGSVQKIACPGEFHYNKLSFFRKDNGSSNEISVCERTCFMAEEGKKYVCRLCGQEVVVTKSGVGTLVCCDQPMELEED